MNIIGPSYTRSPVTQHKNKQIKRAFASEPSHEVEVKVDRRTHGERRQKHNYNYPMDMRQGGDRRRRGHVDLRT